MISQEDIDFIRHNQAWTGTVFNPEMRYYESFIEKARFAASLQKPMYLFINGKEKYPLWKLRNVLSLPWRKIWFIPEPFPEGKIPKGYLLEISRDVSLFYYDRGIR